MTGSAPERPNKNLPTVEKDDLVQLRPWEEISGVFRGFHRAEDHPHVELTTGSLRFAQGSSNARVIERELSNAVGREVAILRMGSSDIVVRINGE